MDKPRLIIDAGHGGQTDIGLSGNLGYNNIKEKDINLEMAVRLAWLCGGHGIGYHMTRWGDRYIALSERCKRANKTEADLFVSIHCNYAFNNEVKGVETLYLSGEGKQYALKFQEGLVELGYSKTRGVKRRDDLYVLNKTKMPAVLLELGFLSNKDDALFLNNENNQVMVATKLFEIVRGFFRPKPTVEKKRIWPLSLGCFRNL